MHNRTNGASLSVWLDEVEMPTFKPLRGDIDADVCVIGAGLAGLASAYLLAREGKRVALVEALGIGAGETGRTTAHFFPPDEWYAGVENGAGRDGARIVAESFAAAIALVERIATEEGIDCEFHRLDGYLYALPGNGFRDFDKEADAARRAGVAVDLLPRVPGLPFDTGPCVRYPGQAQFHPLKYLAGLTAAAVRLGVEIYTGTPASEIVEDAGLRRVITPHGSVTAGSVVVATNTPFNDRVAMHTKQAGYRTYVIGIRMPKGAFPPILLWDTGDPYYYLRLERIADAGSGDDLLIVGGADHKVGQDEHPQHRYDEIERWVRERFPMAGAVAYRWSGEVMEPSDGLAYLGRDPAGKAPVYMITGDSGNGMTHTTIGAMIVTDLIMGRDNPWAGLYDPARKVKHGIGDFLHEQANTLGQYADWATGGEVDSAAEIPAGEGAILRDGMKKIAVYRDASGGLQALSAACTHLGCVVHWNSAERSWDCPCHGSRFATDGTVLHGPAPAALAAVELDDEHRGTPAGDAGRMPGDRPRQP